MLSNAAFCAPDRTTLRETESGAHYDTEERGDASAAFLAQPAWDGCRDTASEAWGAGAAA